MVPEGLSQIQEEKQKYVVELAIQHILSVVQAYHGHIPTIPISPDYVIYSKSHYIVEIENNKWIHEFVLVAFKASYHLEIDSISLFPPEQYAPFFFFFFFKIYLPCSFCLCFSNDIAGTVFQCL